MLRAMRVSAYRQWVQVRTPNFKKWWGHDWQTDIRGTAQDISGAAERGRTAGMDGDVAGRFIFLDERTQEPRVFFHGTRDGFTEFNPKRPEAARMTGCSSAPAFSTCDRFQPEDESSMPTTGCDASLTSAKFNAGSWHLMLHALAGELVVPEPASPGPSEHHRTPDRDLVAAKSLPRPKAPVDRATAARRLPESIDG